MFNLTRFVMLAKAHLAQTMRSYAGFLFVLAIVYVIVILMVLSSNGGRAFNVSGQYTFYYLGLIMSGYVFAARYFKELSHPGAALSFFMQPASTLEKWLLALLWVLVLYPLLYTVLFEVTTYFARIAAVFLQQHKHEQLMLSREEIAVQYEQFIPFVQHKAFDSSAVWDQFGFCLIYMALSAYAIFSALFFNKATMIKGLVGLFVLCLLTAWLGLFTRSHTTFDILSFWFSDGLRWSGENGVGVLRQFGVVLFWFVTPVFLWVATFFALKERDLI